MAIHTCSHSRFQCKLDLNGNTFLFPGQFNNPLSVNAENYKTVVTAELRIWIFIYFIQCGHFTHHNQNMFVGQTVTHNNFPDLVT